MHEHAENLNIYHSACEQGSAPVLKAQQIKLKPVKYCSK